VEGSDFGSGEVEWVGHAVIEVMVEH
jgi:hypothetical protein